MTRNVYVGADFGPLLTAPDFPTLVGLAGQALQLIRDNKPDARMAAIAREIVRNDVDLVGLQEATILRTGPVTTSPDDPTAPLPENIVESDSLELLLKELRRLGQPFQTVAIVPGLDAQLPAITANFAVDARLTTRIVIIARIRSDLKLSNVQAQGFLRNLSFLVAGETTLVNARGWASVDVEKNGRKFRFATTHLDADHPGVRDLQAMDMIAAAGNTNLPLVFVGDFNVTSTTSLDPTYDRFLDAHFVDAWTRKHGSVAGLTCCHLADLSNPTSVGVFDKRLDLVLFRGDFRVESIRLVGEKPGDRIPPGLWPSDHAGVVATLRIPRH